MMAPLPPVLDPYWSISDEDDYIGKIDALYIHNVYTSEINRVEINPRDSRHYETSNSCDVCGNTGHDFDECELNVFLFEKTTHHILTKKEAV